jgi:hypothetical protein
VIALLVVTLFVVGGVVGFAASALFTTRPCDGAGFVSERYGYCVDTPNGWVASPADQEETGLDAFRRSDAATVVMVQAVRLGEGDDLDAFVRQLRTRDEQAGYAVGKAGTGELAGQATREWQVTVSTDTGDVIVREIATVREGTGWYVQVGDVAPTDGGDASTLTESPEIQALLDSWRFA